jgi:hypothetical protein
MCGVLATTGKERLMTGNRTNHARVAMWRRAKNCAPKSPQVRVCETKNMQFWQVISQEIAKMGIREPQKGQFWQSFDKKSPKSRTHGGKT